METNDSGAMPNERETSGLPSGQLDITSVPQTRDGTTTESSAGIFETAPQFIQPWGKTEYRQTETAQIKSGLTRVTYPSDAAHVFAPYRKHGSEKFMSLVLDDTNNVLCLLDHSKGSNTSAKVDPKHIVGAVASIEGAKTVWFAHNHPSGYLVPSYADKDLAGNLEDKFRATGITVAGHLVVGGEGMVARYYDGFHDNEGWEATTTLAARKYSLPVLEQLQRIRTKKAIEQKPVKNYLDAAELFKEQDNELVSILYLDAAEKPISLLTMGQSDAEILRKNNGVIPKRILNEFSRANAHRIILNAPFRSLDSALNLAGFFNCLESGLVRDIIYKDVDQTYKSCQMECNTAFHHVDSFAKLSSNHDSQGVPLTAPDLSSVLKHTAPNLVADRDYQVFDTQDDLFKAYPEVKSEAAIQGWDVIDGVCHKRKLLFVRDHIRSLQQAESLMLHEATHAGVAKMFEDEGISDALNRLYLTMGGEKGFLKTVDELGLMPSIASYISGIKSASAKPGFKLSEKEKNTVLVNELLAFVGQKKSTSIRDRAREVVGGMRQWLRGKGFLAMSKVSTSEICYIAKSARELALSGELGNDDQTRFMVAYHGTPARVDEFSTKHIGSGEGAQAFGWGLYFTESKKIGQWYRDSLSAAQNLGLPRYKMLRDPLSRKELNVVREANAAHAKALARIEPKRMSSNFSGTGGFSNFVQLYNGKQLAAKADERYRKQFGEEISAELDRLFANAKLRKPDSSDEEIRNTFEELGLYNKLRPYSYAYDEAFEVVKRHANGNLYQVDIPEEQHYLDWDKTLDEQSDFVQHALRDAGLKFADSSEITGRELYDLFYEVTARKGSGSYTEAMKSASLYLNDMGIPGLRYLDGMSRNNPTKDPSYNYVVWDEAVITIEAVNEQQRVFKGSAPKLDLKQAEKTKTDLKQWIGHGTLRNQDSGEPLVFYRGMRVSDAATQRGGLTERYYTNDVDYADTYANDYDNGVVLPVHIAGQFYIVDEINDVTNWEFSDHQAELEAQGYHGIASSDFSVVYPFGMDDYDQIKPALAPNQSFEKNNAHSLDMASAN